MAEIELTSNNPRRSVDGPPRLYQNEQSAAGGRPCSFNTAAFGTTEAGNQILAPGILAQVAFLEGLCPYECVYMIENPSVRHCVASKSCSNAAD